MAEIDCECDDEVVPGACPGFNGRDEVQRCDMCQRFPDDEAAAKAVAAVVGGTAVERHDPALTEGAYWWVIVKDGAELTADQIEEAGR